MLQARDQHELDAAQREWHAARAALAHS
jgi:hypothetical protein